MTDNTEDLNLDFGKIFGFFKRKKKTEENKETPTKPEEDVSISLNTKKIKSFFKKSKGKDDENTESIDFTNLKKFVVKYNVLCILVLLIFLQFIPNAGFWPWGGIWMRTQSENLPKIDDWATESVHNFYKGQISDQINKQYPNLPEQNKNKLVNKEFNTFISENTEQADLQITATANQLRSRFQYESDGKTYNYMPDIDPYTYLRFARNKIEKGHFEDTIKDGVTWDDHSLAPIGRKVTIGFHHYFLFYLYKFFKIFSSKITLMQSATYFPIVMLLFSLIPAFFIGRRLSNNVGGFFAASMLILNTAAFTRTTWGHADTDAYTIFFPVLIVWLFIESIACKDYKRKLLYSLITGISMGFFSLAWGGGWWYVFYFILAAMFINLVYLVCINYKELIKQPSLIIKLSEVKNILFVTSIFVVLSAFFITILKSFEAFYSSLFSPFGFTIIKSASHASLWPNVYTTVAELNPASINSIIQSIGGRFLLFVAVLGIFLTLNIKDSSGKRDIKYSTLLIIWFIATIYASTKGIRFVLLMVPAFSIAFGVAAGNIHRLATGWMKKSLKIPKWTSGVVIIIIFGILLISPVKSSYTSVKNDFPIINDAWWNALTKIKTESAPDAIINSWWDFGHHFKFIADRAVTFDGATQNLPHAHWIGKVLSTDDEDTALGILRMLDCGSNTAFKVLNKKIEDTPKTVDVLYKVIVSDKKEAENILSKYTDNPQEIMKYTHCDPPENYFITSADMINKAGVWSHFGGWNFERADIWMNLRKLPSEQAINAMVEKYNYSKEKAETHYFEVQALQDEKEANTWISAWPGYASGVNGCSESNNIIKCGNGLVVKKNNSDYDALINVQGGAGVPRSLVYVDKKSQKVIEKEYNNSEVAVSAVLIPEGKGYQSVLVSKELAMSMFTRLFFLEGQGLKHFDLFDEQRQVTGGIIYVWKVDWQGHDPNINPDLIEKTIVSEGDSVIVDYIGWTENETIFDSSIKDWASKNVSKDTDFSGQDTKSLKFSVGSGQMIKGFDKGIRGMNKGSVKTIKIAPEDAYGTDPEKHPLGNQILNFKIKIVEIN